MVVGKWANPETLATSHWSVLPVGRKYLDVNAPCGACIVVSQNHDTENSLVDSPQTLHQSCNTHSSAFLGFQCMEMPI